MGITVHHPWVLGLAPLLFTALVLLARRSLAGLAPARRRLALGARIVVVTLVVAALAEVEWVGPARDVEVVLVVDRSRSIPAEPAGVARRVVEAVRADVGERGRARVVTFGRDAQHQGALHPAGPPLPLDDPLDPDATDLEAGLSRALDVLDPGARGRLLLLSDGNETRGDVRRALARARREGVAVDVVPLTYSHESDLLLEEVVVPPSAAPGEPYRARVVMRATAPAAAVLRVWRDGALVDARRVDLVEGLNVEEVELVSATAGFARIEAALEALDPDADDTPQNDVAYGFVHTPGPSSVLLVRDAADGGQEDALLGALRAAGLRVDVVAPADAPLSRGELQDRDAVVLDGVARGAFSDAQLAALEGAVAHLGVGLIMIGGPEGFGAGDWGGTPVEDALPVRMDPRTQDVALATALVLVLDRSGSMAGEKLEHSKAAAIAAASTLGAADRVGVVAFSDRGEWVVALAPGGDAARVRAGVEPIGAEGGTAMATGLRLALQGLRGCPDAAVRHVLALTDGRSAPEDLLRLATTLRVEGMTASFVGVGADADDDSLRRLARAGGGRYYDVDDPRRVPHVFVKETRRIARTLVREGPFEPEARAGSAILGDLTAAPTLRGLVRAEAKPRAEVALTGPDGAPVLACWQYGLGRAVAFTSDARPVWAADWVAWDGFDAFWSRTLRWAARSVEASTLAASVSFVDGRAQVGVDAVDAAGDLVDALALTARVRSPGGEERVVTLQQRGAGRYQADLPVDGRGTHEVTVVSVAPSGRREAVTTGLVVPWSQEHRAVRSDDARLRELAASSGGRLIPPWDLIERRVDPWDEEGLGPRGAHGETWAALLAAAVAMFLLDVAVRRVALPGRASASPPLAAASGPAPPAAPATPAAPAPVTGGDTAPAGAAALTARLLAAKRRRPGGAKAP